MSQFYNSYFAL